MLKTPKLYIVKIKNGRKPIPTFWTNIVMGHSVTNDEHHMPTELPLPVKYSIAVKALEKAHSCGWKISGFFISRACSEKKMREYYRNPLRQQLHLFSRELQMF
jgi:hypothetical protein